MMMRDQWLACEGDPVWVLTDCDELIGVYLTPEAGGEAARGLTGRDITWVVEDGLWMDDEYEPQLILTRTTISIG